MQRGRSAGLVAAFILTTAVVCRAGAPHSVEIRDPFFSSVPFAEWQAEGKRRQIRWEVEFFPVELSVHQRLLERVRIEVDHDPALEPVPRPLAILIEYRDETGRVWQKHVLSGGEGDPAGRETIVFGNAFVLPGVYRLSIAVFDPRTLEHSFISNRIHAKAPANDPLPDAWDGLPPVEFLPARANAPDEWFLPSLRNGSLNVRLLDLVTRRVPFEQNGVRVLDWPALRRFFLESRPGVIDASALGGFWKMRTFLWDQVAAAAMVPRAGETRITLILSGPAFFPGQEAPPISGLARQENAFLFYVRYRPFEFPRRSRRRPGSRPFPERPLVRPLPDDELETAARKVNARVFDVTSPAEFRRVLALLMAQMGRI
jgi:hypothetical protein